ncbi:biphenyl-2,3-diol 1,2-dioxygenase III-related protein [Elsinoe ampelina]|uniref:Biphenyl-2,3-diol 1,2-dioxygenase III-related protein n=1 Tax=Elsinoe ampelina TaxID=302913 RepID=A0A6A6G7V2_9PEZI|nr:biphenyl-2,3-diol 1,2-dioxygenase III-related protein [Elsinoe ampelina]
MSPIAQVQSIDHVVLTCKSIPDTIAFYTSLGMEHEPFGEGRNALKFGTQKINLHQAGAEFEPKATLAKPGTADLCFIVSTNVDEVLGKLKREGIEILEGGQVVTRTGARGQLRSVYMRDPDGNLIELSNYTEE